MVKHLKFSPMIFWINHINNDVEVKNVIWFHSDIYIHILYYAVYMSIL